MRKVQELNKTLGEALAAIDACTELEEDWDGEDSIPATVEAAAVAKDVLRGVTERAMEGLFTWRKPSIGAMGDGGIVLSWDIAGRRVMLVAGPDRSQGITCVTEVPGQRPLREVESVGDAVEKAVATLRSR
jgi:hypothetical protein